ncbi:hypothetical protein [Sphingomicrobium flavum]|uniref:hypothetical protein n=1 Tax=Sphingomicrobium flavum TaxID=1229164 RepID=UPI0021AD9275|nr:hypothetical protein [Sphingomicrobium flavum]
MAKAVRSAGKGSRWRSTQGCFYRQSGDWFVSASPVVALNNTSSRGVIQVKPMTIDPLFWDIVGLPENRQQPLSFRLTGAFSCRAPAFRESGIEEVENAEAVAVRLCDLADRALNDLELWSMEDFITSCRMHGADADSYLSALVPALILAGRSSEALEACEAAKARGSSGGFGFPAGSLCDLAIRWIERHA